MSNDIFENIPIEQLNLSHRALGSLKRTQILMIADLLNYTQQDLEILDPSVASEVLPALKQKFGLTLPQNDLQ